MFVPDQISAKKRRGNRDTEEEVLIQRTTNLVRLVFRVVSAVGLFVLSIYFFLTGQTLVGLIFLVIAGVTLYPAAKDYAAQSEFKECIFCEKDTLNWCQPEWANGYVCAECAKNRKPLDFCERDNETGSSGGIGIDIL